ncbi:hypothetical protein FVE85_0007 [Porphyridium purpureum]|uniref:Uncharacterized protein n=1 Tax=Porphyridium purpureum TaxID=35688 RepID=A0A5J4YYT3_PORPP|nr:hypothetical protein FVE85_0007 [Porphyridium purpureum]|eukprot:POR2856..scf208_2
MLGDGPKCSAHDAHLAPSRCTGSFACRSLVGSADFDRVEIQAEDFNAGGGMLPGKYVDVLVGDESEVEAEKVVQIRCPGNELENEHRYRAALELCLGEV